MGETGQSREFRRCRDLLLRHAQDYQAARLAFAWPDLRQFNWALEWFDVIAADNHGTALRILADDGTQQRLTFAQMAQRSSQVANYLRAAGVGRGTRVLMMLPNIAPLWELMLACIKLGAVLIPSTPLLTRAEIMDRMSRGRVACVVTTSDQCEKFSGVAAEVTRFVIGDGSEGWRRYADAFEESAYFKPVGATQADDPLLLYFTSGTSARPKLVMHSHRSYPVGHLTTMYWLGLRPGDVHLNISSSGWAKHAWSSFFAPWNAEATILVINHARFEARRLLDVLVDSRVSTVCAPTTVWRAVVQEDLRQWKIALREAASAGEPMNPEVIEQVRSAWGITIRDGFGQTETTALVGNSPNQEVRTASMGRPLPGYEIVLADESGIPSDEGELCVELEPARPTGVMMGYADDAGEVRPLTGALYRTGDVARRDADGWITYVGRADDVFKCSDYRISPFELESALIEHPAVAEAAIVPCPDALRLSIPKAYVTLVAGHEAVAATALSIFHFLRARLAPFKRVRRIEFTPELPKTISGKIRRAELRTAEAGRSRGDPRRECEWIEDDFPELRRGV